MFTLNKFITKIISGQDYRVDCIFERDHIRPKQRASNKVDLFVGEVEQVKRFGDQQISQSFCNFQGSKGELESVNGDREISLHQFEQVVKAFKLSFDIKSIRRFFSTGMDSNPESLGLRKKILDIFFADIVISRYLSRPSPQIQGCELVLPSKYERSLYLSAIERRDEYFISYRGPGLPNRYFDFSDPRQAFYVRPTPHQRENEVIFPEAMSKVSGMLSSNISFCLGAQRNLYEVMEKIEEMEKNSSSIQCQNDVTINNNVEFNFQYFVFVTGDKMGHAVTMAGIFDETMGKMVCALVVNSWKNKDYYEMIIERRFSAKLRSVPLIDCSIDIQTGQMDNNCAIYACAIGRALVELFYNDQKTLEVICRDFQRAHNAEEIQKFVRTNICQYLPEYFFKGKNDQFQAKSMEELRAFHMQKRWDIGRHDVQKISQGSTGRVAELKKQWAS